MSPIAHRPSPAQQARIFLLALKYWALDGDTWPEAKACAEIIVLGFRK